MCVCEKAREGEDVRETEAERRRGEEKSMCVMCLALLYIRFCRESRLVGFLFSNINADECVFVRVVCS